MSKYDSYLPNFNINYLPIISINDFSFSYSIESMFDTLSNMLSNFYNKVTFMGDILNKFITIDRIYLKQLNEQFNNYRSMFMSLSSSEIKQANEIFLYNTSEKIPKLSEYINIMKTFYIVANDVCSIISKCVNTDNVTVVPTIDDLFGNANLSQYETIGLEIDDPYIRFNNPFENNPDDTYLKELGYTSLSDIQTVWNTYDHQVLFSLNRLIKMKDVLVRQYAMLKTELEKSDNDDEDIYLYFKAALFTATTMCSVTSKLLELNRIMMFKNKVLIDTVNKSILTVVDKRN